MRGAILYGPRDVRFEERPDPRIIEPTDAIIRIAAACVCGSDLWPYRGQVQYPALHAREIAVICETRFDRRPSPHTIKRVPAEGNPPPARRDRRYPPYHAMPDPHARRYAVVQLHSAGGSIKAIAGYLETIRPTLYAILARWVTEKTADGAIPRLSNGCARSISRPATPCANCKRTPNAKLSSMAKQVPIHREP